MDKYRILELFIPFLAAILTSSGFWLYIEKRYSTKDLGKKLLVGLAHDRIVDLSLKYIERGWISQDEHENLCGFLYEPYIEMGGNGSVKRLMSEVDKLPIINRSPHEKERSNNVPIQQ